MEYFGLPPIRRSGEHPWSLREDAVKDGRERVLCILNTDPPDSFDLYAFSKADVSTLHRDGVCV